MHGGAVVIDFVTLMADVLWHLAWIPACGLAAFAVSRWMSPRRHGRAHHPVYRPCHIPPPAPSDRCTLFHAHTAGRTDSETPDAERRAA